MPKTVKSNKDYLAIYDGVVPYRCYSLTDITWEAGHSYTYEVTITRESGVWVNNVSVSPWTPQDGGSLETE